MTTRGIISDKWSSRVLWLTALGSAVGLYMVAVERQTQNRERMLAEALRAEESGVNSSETVHDVTVKEIKVANIDQSASV